MTDLKQTTLADLRAMKERGELPAPAGAGEDRLSEGFWGDAEARPPLDGPQGLRVKIANVLRDDALQMLSDYDVEPDLASHDPEFGDALFVTVDAVMALLEPAPAFDLTNIIAAGNRLSFAAQTTGGTVGPDRDLIAAIDGWTAAVSASIAFDLTNPGKLRFKDWPRGAQGEFCLEVMKRRRTAETFIDGEWVERDLAHFSFRTGYAIVRLAPTAEEGEG